MGTTLQEQLDWLNEAREADADPGFPGRMSAFCSLPSTGQGKRSHFARTNGTFTLAMSAVGNTRFPCGNLPRPLLAWVCTEAVRMSLRELVLGKGLRDFVACPRIYNDGRTRRRRLRDRMEPLLSCALSQPFFDSTLRQPVPIGLNRLHALRRSNPGLDFYPWLTCRTFLLTDPLALTWRQVYAQHGPLPEKVGNNLLSKTFVKKVSPGTEENQAHLARAGPLHRAMAAHPSSHSATGPRRARARRLRLSVYLMTPLSCPTSLKVTAGPSSLPKSFSRAILGWGLGSPPAARLVLGPLGRRKPAARTLPLAPSGPSVIALLMPPWRGPALGSASSSRYRVWPLPPVAGERQTLTNP